MHSPYSSSSSDSSVSSADSYRRRHRRRHKSKSRKAQQMYGDDRNRYSKEARKLSPLLMKHGLKICDEKPRSYKKKHSFRDDDYASREQDSSVSRRELDEIKRRHEKELKNLMKFLEKESSLLSGIEEEKREELYELKRQHEKEVKKLFEFQEKELAIITDKHARKQAELEDRLAKVQVNANEEMQRCKEDILALEEELQSRTQKSNYELRELNNELSTSLRQTSLLDNEIQILNDQLTNKDKYIKQLEDATAEKDRYILQLEGANEKSSFVEKELRDEIRRRDDEIRRKDRAILRKNEEIRSLNSKPSSQEQMESINLNGYEWEEASGLTTSSDFDIRKDPLEKYRERPPQLKRFTSDTSRKTTPHSSSKRRENRDDLEARRLSVSFSDEVERRHLPMQTHDTLSRRLENLYLDR